MTFNKISLAALAIASALFCLATVARADYGSGGPAAEATSKDQGESLYERLGGTDAIAAVVDRFVDVLAADERLTKNQVVAERLGKHTLAGIKFQVSAFMIMATGGPMVYQGHDMKTAHKGLMISEDEWNASGEDFVMVLNEFKVPQELQDELLALIMSTKADIVGQ